MKRLIRILHRVEDGLIVTVLLLMVLLAVAQIVLRNLAGTSLIWVEPFLQHGVLWIGLLGAMIASRKDEHIRIDIASHYFPRPVRRLLAILVDLFTCGICTLVAWHSAGYVREEMSFGTEGFLGLPSWILQLIIPIGFGVIALRYAILFVMDVRGQREPLPETLV